MFPAKGLLYVVIIMRETDMENKSRMLHYSTQRVSAY